MKKLITAVLLLLLAASTLACGKVKLHCDSCGKEVYADSKMDESWAVFCSDCEPELDLE